MEETRRRIFNHAKNPACHISNPEEVEVAIKELQAKADATPPGSARQSILIDIAKLRAYADMKRWATAPKR